jgi:hypothetical protein
LASNALLTTLHPLLENLLQTVYSKLQEDSGTGAFLASELYFRGWKSQESHGVRSGIHVLGLIDEL